jgi:hypothetical protein
MGVSSIKFRPVPVLIVDIGYWCGVPCLRWEVASDRAVSEMYSKSNVGVVKPFGSADLFVILMLRLSVQNSK